jgi:hypothetical protein
MVAMVPHAEGLLTSRKLQDYSSVTKRTLFEIPSDHKSSFGEKEKVIASRYT